MPKKKDSQTQGAFSYTNIITRLDINKKFLASHRSIIDERLKSAGQEILNGLKSNLDNADISGINKCLQLASTILLLGTKSENISRELDSVAIENKDAHIADIDPSTILTMAVLYHLLTVKETEKGAAVPDNLSAIRERFSKIKWLIGEHWMEKLEIQ